MKSDPWQGQLLDVVHTTLNCGVAPEVIADELQMLADSVMDAKHSSGERPSSGGSLSGEGAPSPTQAPSDGVAPDGAPPETPNESSYAPESRS